MAGFGKLFGGRGKEKVYIFVSTYKTLNVKNYQYQGEAHICTKRLRNF